MIKFITIGHSLAHEVQSIIQVFYPNVHYSKTDKVDKSGITIVSIIKDNKCRALLYEDAKKIAESCINIEDSGSKYLSDSKKELKRFIKTSIYKLLIDNRQDEFPWGILTGIRPSKNVNDFFEAGASDKEIEDILKQKYFVSDSKIDLAIKVAKAEKEILSSNDGTLASIYIGIPFCATRCLYCSFASFPLSKYKDRVDLYMEALKKEMEYLSNYSKRYKIETIYIGGGTPTALNEKQLEFLLTLVNKYFDVANLKEFTLEAGRPDTINKEKLHIIKDYGVTRISINPQTMNQETLDIIGRKHTTKDIVDIFNIARELKYNNINMDIILGLPNETIRHVENTLQQITSLNPDSITVHTLTIKRASELKETLNRHKITDSTSLRKMLNISSIYADKMNMYPYYMYRQKNMLGNFENVGYCKQNKECIYNVQIMEEKQTILSVGAGSTTKLVYPNGRIERVFNVKNLDDYIRRIDEMIQRKIDGLPL